MDPVYINGKSKIENRKWTNFNRPSSIVNQQSLIYNIQYTIYNSKARRAFTLVELMIVVAVLGILAAIALPEFQNHAKQAKEAAAKESLRLFRTAVQRYAADHNGTPPGYPNGDMTVPCSIPYVLAHLTLKSSNTKGEVADPGTPGYPYGPYLSEIPINPLNDMQTISILQNSTDSFPETGNGLCGWFYKPSTLEIRLNAVGPEDADTKYIDY